jgi:predicted metalloprotease
MRWEDFRQSSNIEDDREASASRGGGIPGGSGGLGIGMVIILGLIGWALGIDPSVLIGGAQILSGGGQTTQQSGPAPEVERHAKRPDWSVRSRGVGQHRGCLDRDLRRQWAYLSSAKAAALLRL